MKYELIGVGVKTGSKITLSIEDDSPNGAIEKASRKHPGYDFYTTKEGRFNTVTLINLLNAISLRQTNLKNNN